MPPKIKKKFTDDGEEQVITPVVPIVNGFKPSLDSNNYHSTFNNKRKHQKHTDFETDTKSKPLSKAPNGEVLMKKKHKKNDLKEIKEKLKKAWIEKKKQHNNQNLRKGNNVRFLDSEDEEEADLIAPDFDDETDRTQKSHSKDPSVARNEYTMRQNLKNTLFKTRKTLPMYQARSEVIERILSNEVTVLLGETGSGKSTQLPQLIHDATLVKKKKKNGHEIKVSTEKIAITQPRRVAAVSLASRVAQEMGVELGKDVGYSVRFDNNSHPAFTSIKYVTDGMLLRELMADPNLSKYTTVILDEAHERTLLTDLSMGMLKSLQEKRRGTDSPLRLIIMSATLDAERFSKFFDNCDILLVEGKMYPVTRYYLNESVDDVIDAMIQSVCQVNLSEPTGDILAFLPGQEEIEKVVQRLNEIAKDLPKTAPLIVALPLYASLPPVQQQKAFERLPKNKRKVICATNIAETSLTVSGVRYVIDSGLRKVKVFRPDLGMDTLLTAPVSQSSANQRMGRAGREAPGKCFRLFTEETYSAELPKQTEAEITRTDVSTAVLLLKRAGVDDVLSFNWVESPGKKALKAALLKLYGLKALGDDSKITELGIKMALLPVPPQLAAVLLQANELGGLKLLSTVIDVAACLSVDGVMMNPHPDKRDEINERRKQQFSGGTEWGDLIMMKEVYNAFMELPLGLEQKAWCKDVAVNYKAMKNVVRVRRQIMQYMETILGHNNSKGKKKNHKSKKDEDDDEDQDELESLTNGQYDAVGILKCFLHGYIASTAIGLPDSRYRSVTNGQLLSIHPSSMMFGQRREAIMYMELVYTQKPYARTVSPIKVEWINEVAPHLLKL